MTIIALAKMAQSNPYSMISKVPTTAMAIKLINSGIKHSKVNAKMLISAFTVWVCNHDVRLSAGLHSLLVTRGCSRVSTALEKPPSKAAFSTSPRSPAVTRSSWERTLAGMSSRSFSLRLGRMTRFTPARWAARTLSLIPPTWGSRTKQRVR